MEKNSCILVSEKLDFMWRCFIDLLSDFNPVDNLGVPKKYYVGNSNLDTFTVLSTAFDGDDCWMF